MEFIQIEVQPRDAVGTANANRLRRAGNVPAVLYGMKRRNLALTIAGTEFARFLRTGSHLVELRLGEETRPAILREMQVDAVTDAILHVDFHRVDHDAEVDTEVPLIFKGRAKGEGEGGVFQVVQGTIAIRARPKDLRSDYTIDIREITLGQTVTVGDVEAGEGVTLTEDPSTLLAHCVMPKAVAEPAVEEGGVAPAEGGAEAEAEDAEA